MKLNVFLIKGYWRRNDTLDKIFPMKIPSISFTSKYPILTFLVLLFLATACSKDEGTPEKESEKKKEEIIADEDKIPLVTINTNGVAIPDEPKVDADVTLAEKGEITFTGKIGIEIRGSSSQMFPKKSYGFETRDINNEDIDIPFLGFPEEEDWILYGPYSDKSLMRNKLIFDLARDLGGYASRTEFVDLNINDSYKGVYVLMEKIKRDAFRVDINKLKGDENTGEDLTGGYILKIDKTTGTPGGELNSLNSFVSPHAPMNGTAGQTIAYQYEYPKSEDITAEQRTYISDYVTQFENALASDDFMDMDLGYNAYIDTDSFIDFFLLNELSNNVDGYRLSTFMYKDKNEKLKMGPIWDFNLAFGNADYCEGGETNVWAYKFNERCSADYWLVPFWWDRLLQDPSFVVKVQSRWAELRGGVFAEGAILSKLDDYTNTLDKAGALDTNFESWNIFGTYIWPNNYIGTSHDDEIGYLKGWVSDRLNWLDQAIEDL